MNGWQIALLALEGVFALASGVAIVFIIIYLPKIYGVVKSIWAAQKVELKWLDEAYKKLTVQKGKK